MSTEIELSARAKKIGAFVFVIIFSFLIGCTKENFVEPVDPFVDQNLESNPDVFTIGQGSSALKIKTNPANVINTENGVRIKGTIFVENSKYGDMPLSTGDFELVKNSSDNFYSNITGFSKVQLPREGILKDLQMVGLPAAAMGFKKGSDFDTGALNWPVNPNRYYFYYENTNDNPFQAEVTKSSFKNIKKVAIDPTDPFTFFTCDFTGTKLGDLSDVGMAVSTQGLIPFDPLVKLGDIKGFNGNFYFTGTIPLQSYPIAFTGEACLAFNSGDPNGIKNFFSGNNTNFKLGLNGQATFDNTALDWLNVQVVLGQATLVLSVNQSGDTDIQFAGIRELPPSTPSDFLYQIIGKDWDFLDYLVPIQQKETFYGRIGTKLSDWKLGFKSESSLNLPNNIHLDMGKTQLEISSSQMYFMGEAVVGGLNRVGVEGYANKNGNFKLTGYGKNSLHSHVGKLSIGYSLGMSVTVQYENGVFTFKGDFKFRGEACVTIAKHDFCASISVSGDVSISSNGSFEICFSIGIGKLGFDVCINYDRNSNAVGELFDQTMTATEIPLEQVPLENRFPAVECDTGQIK